MSTVNIDQVTAEGLRAGEFREVLPEYYALADYTENNAWHKQQNVLDHVIAVYEALEKLLSTARWPSALQGYLSQRISMNGPEFHNRQQLLKIAVLLHDIAKPETLITSPTGITSCPGHELIGCLRVHEFIPHFGLDVYAEKHVERIVRYHGFVSEVLFLIADHGRAEHYMSYLRQFASDSTTELLLHAYADMLGCDAPPGVLPGLERIIVEQIEAGLATLKR